MNSRSFTIVELLIVIVVIAILASISIVAYSGIQGRAQQSAVQSDLRRFATVMEIERSDSGSYPAILTAAMGIQFSRSSYGYDAQNANARYCYNGSNGQYILYASTKTGSYFKVTPAGVSAAIQTYGWGVCDQIGMYQTNPTQNGFTGGSSGTWANWVN